MVNKVTANILRGNQALAAVRRVDLRDLQQAAKSMRPGVESKLTLLNLAMHRFRESLSGVPEYFVVGGGYQAERHTKVGVFLNSGLQEMNSIFESIHLQKRTSLVDLGSGMGDIIFLAAIYGVKAEGLELDPELVEISKIIQKKLCRFIPEVKNARFFKKDYLKFDLGRHDTVYHFRNVSDEGLELEEKFSREAKPLTLFIVKTAHKPSGFSGIYSSYYEDVSRKMPIPLISHYAGMFAYMRGSLPFTELV